jgi:hypothetical protein
VPAGAAAVGLGATAGGVALVMARDLVALRYHAEHDSVFLYAFDLIQLNGDVPVEDRPPVDNAGHEQRKGDQADHPRPAADRAQARRNSSYPALCRRFVLPSPRREYLARCLSGERCRRGGAVKEPLPSIRARCNGLVALALSRKAPQASSCSGR